MRTKNSIYNTIMLLAQQVITAVCGMIVPVLIINTYGSAINGTVSSITQFLSYIVLLESGIGGVIGAALYKPLAEHNNKRLSEIVVTTEKFFKNIAVIFCIYILVVACVYPLLVNSRYSWWYTFSLVLIISISTLAQYFFGITYQILIQSDQKVWLVAKIQIFTSIFTTLLTIFCIRIGLKIHTLKLVCAIIYIVRPIIFNVYVHKKYIIDRRVKPNKDVIKQRWDGFAHHIAYIIHYNTDITLLTVFTSVLEVSVYSVYYNVVSGIYRIISSVATGIMASVGNMVVKREQEALSRTLDIYETFNFMLVSILYTCTALLILPFVRIYTKGVVDVNYYRPLFSVVLIAAEASYALRNPYDMVIFAAGHFKQTKRGAYQEATINIIISLVLVNILGIVGVAIGTFVAMILRTIQYVIYLKNNILYRPISIFLKKGIINILAIVTSIFVLECLPSYEIASYLTWGKYAIIVLIIVTAIVAAFNIFFYRKIMKNIIAILKNSKNKEVKL